MVASFAIIRSTAYYTRQSAAVRYYEAGTEAGGVWLRGHERLGIVAGDAVVAADFDRVCQAVDRHGNVLVKPARGQKRALGFDLTLSSPKSVGVAWACGSQPLRELIGSGEREAVEFILRVIEREIPLARRGHNGARRETAKFVAAVFTHSESRPEKHSDGSVMASPQRHHHLCLPSLGERLDGTWGALDTIAPRQWKKAIGALYRLALATALQERGFAIEVEEDDWRWAIAGVPKEVCEFFSARRNALEEELAEAGVTSTSAPALAAALTLSGRRDKQVLGGAELAEQWKAAIERLGYVPETIVRDARAAGRAAEAKAGKNERHRLAEQRFTAVPAKLTERSATFERRQLLEASANALVGSGAKADRAIERADELVADGVAVMLGQTRDGLVYSTPEMIAIERDLVRTAQRLAAAAVYRPDPQLIETLVADQGLNAEQADVARVATSGKCLILVQGGAGTGKSTSLKAISAAWQSAGYEVVGAAVAWRAANILRDDLGIPARAVDSWLARTETGQAAFRPRTCLIVEEAGLQSSPQALRLLREVEKANGVCIAVGDEGQILPLGPGHGMRLIRESVGAVEIATVVRQREEWARLAPACFARGDAKAALQAYSDRDLVQLHEGLRATIEALVEEWRRQVEAEPDQSLLITAKTNAEVRAISAAVRVRLRDRGLIDEAEYAILASDASGNGYTLRLSAGDSIRFLQRQDQLGVINGTEALVIGIDAMAEGSLRITAERADGERFSFVPSDVADAKGRAKLSHGYASTLFGAQGLTVDRTLVLLSSRFDRHDSYVAASRARGATTFFLDARALDKEMMEKKRGVTDSDLRRARLAYLAARLARTSAKTTTLDLIAAPADRSPQSHRSRTRARSRELSHEP